MAGTGKKAKNAQQHDDHRLREAVAEIARSTNLRFLVRGLLGECGVHSIFPSENALATARAAGRHEIGMGLIATFTLYHPTLYPQLLLEEADENAERSYEQTTYEHPE